MMFSLVIYNHKVRGLGLVYRETMVLSQWRYGMFGFITKVDKLRLR